MPHFADGTWPDHSGLWYQLNSTISNTTATNATVTTFTVPAVEHQIDRTVSPHRYTTFCRFTIYYRVASIDSGGTAPTASFSLDYTTPDTQQTATISFTSVNALTLNAVNSHQVMVPIMPGTTVTLKRSTGGTVGGTPATVMLDFAAEGV